MVFIYSFMYTKKTDLVIRLRGLAKPTYLISKSARIAATVYLFLTR